MIRVVTARSAGAEDYNGAPVPDIISHGDETKAFDPLIKLAHWLTLFLIVAIFSTAAPIHDVPDAWKLTLFQLHRSLGATIWIVTVMRLIWRQFTRLPAWPPSLSNPMRTAARSVEYMLYGLLLLQPILGLLYANAHGGRTGVFFVLRLPPLIQRNDELAEQLLLAHGAVATLLLAVIALHAAAALFHHFIRRDEILNRMLPKALQHSA